MNTLDLIDSFSEFKEQKNIDKLKMMRLLEDTFKTSLKKKYGNTDNFDVVVNTDKGQIEIYQIRTIVPDDEVEDTVKEVGLTEAQILDSSFELGEETYEQIEIQQFTRRSIMDAKQTLNSRVTELEKDEVYKKCKDQQSKIDEDIVNYVKGIYSPFTAEEISNKIAQMLKTDDINAEVEVIYQSIEGLHKACPDNLGDWYFTGNYPTPGGNRVVNEAFINFYEGNDKRAY